MVQKLAIFGSLMYFRTPGSMVPSTSSIMNRSREWKTSALTMVSWRRFVFALREREAAMNSRSLISRLRHVFQYSVVRRAVSRLVNQASKFSSRSSDSSGSTMLRQLGKRGFLTTARGCFAVCEMPRAPWLSCFVRADRL